MKGTKALLMAGLLGIAFSSCQRESRPEVNNPLSPSGEVSFHTNIIKRTTRATDTKWDLSDAIGVYALESGKTLPSGVYADFANVKYTTPGTGIFSAASKAITFPKSGTLDFVAYHPYTEQVDGSKISVDTRDQSKPSNIDLLHSADAKGKSAEDEEVAMTFRHRLSKLVVEVSGNGSLSNLSAKLSGLVTKGEMNLVDGTVSPGTAKEEMTLTPTTVDGKTLLSAILVPGQDLKDAKMTLSLAGKNYEWTPGAQALESNKKYIYKLELKSDGTVKEVRIEGAVIEDWGAGNTPGDPIVLDPINGGDTPTPPQPDPDPKPTPDPGKMVEYYKEDFNAIEILDKNYKDIKTVLDILNVNGLDYTGSEGISIRANAFISDVHAWFFQPKDPKYPVSRLKVSGFKTGYSGQELHLDINAQNSGSSPSHLTVKVNGQTVTPTDNSEIPTGKTYKTYVYKLSGDEVTSLEIYANPENLGLRVDNIVLKGSKK